MSVVWEGASVHLDEDVGPDEQGQEVKVKEIS
jgi:hypothetical protein